MTIARYLLCPGPVLSRSDGDRHHVGASALVALYGVAESECLVLPCSGASHDPQYSFLRKCLLSRVDSGELVALHPRSDGDYRLPA